MFVYVFVCVCSCFFFCFTTYCSYFFLKRNALFMVIKYRIKISQKEHFSSNRVSFDCVSSSWYVFFFESRYRLLWSLVISDVLSFQWQQMNQFELNRAWIETYLHDVTYHWQSQTFTTRNEMNKSFSPIWLRRKWSEISNFLCQRSIIFDDNHHLNRICKYPCCCFYCFLACC